MTRREKSLFITLAFLVLLVFIMSLSGCGPAYHLKRAEHHIDKAIKKGADIKKDTIIFYFKSPEIKFQTTFKPQWLDGAPVPLWRDTLTTKDPKTGATVKAKIDLKKDCPDDCIKTVYLAADVPPQDQKAEVPCDTLEAGYTLWEIIILGIACLAVGAVASRIFWR